jgi:predicted homoserine dehydrogenase-like protein
LHILRRTHRQDYETFSPGVILSTHHHRHHHQVNLISEDEHDGSARLAFLSTPFHSAKISSPLSVRVSDLASATNAVLHPIKELSKSRELDEISNKHKKSTN